MEKKKVLLSLLRGETPTISSSDDLTDGDYKKPAFTPRSAEEKWWSKTDLIK